MTSTITITRYTRVGYGCTSRPEQTPAGLRIAAPEQRWTGTPRTVREARSERLRSIGVTGGGSCEYREAYYVGGRRVVESYRGETSDALAMLCDGVVSEATITVDFGEL
jgi:hypothetical protein